MPLTPKLKIDLKPDPEKRARRKKSAQELSNSMSVATGSQTGSMGSMPNSKGPDALGMAKNIAILMKVFSDKKLKKNIRTINNSMEILYG